MFTMGFGQWLANLFGGKAVADANRVAADVSGLNQQLAAGNYQGAMAQGQAMVGQAAAGGYGGQPAPAPAGQYGMMDPNAYQQMMQQAMAQNAQQRQAEINQLVAANPQLMEPIEGVTLEQYAQLAAKASSGMSQPQFDQFLMQNGMDRARYDRVAAGWNGRMSQDATASLAQIYGQAFGGAGAGAFGAAGAAGASALGAIAQGGMPAGVAGAEPCTWEKYNEIGGAQRAWSMSGKDVNAMLAQTFGINAQDWSNMSQYWMGRLMTEPQRAMEMETLQQQWAQRYAAPAADTDLRF